MQAILITDNQMMNKLIIYFVVLLIGGCSSPQPTEQKPIDQYYSYASMGEWQKALPIIANLAQKEPDVPTSWFNYGICLEELKKHHEAISAFEKAYELDSLDFGAQYRIFKNYALAGDAEGFVAFTKTEVIKTPQIIELIDKREEFKSMVSSKSYIEFKKRL